MSWELSFISEKDFTNHVKDTIDKYGEKLESFDIVRFNKNIVDPIKMIFDKTVYQTSWDEIVGNEIFRQRDKSNNNDIGYFHQRIFQYINNCHVPDNGTEGGWDVIFQVPEGITLPEGDIVHTVYVEMKNKHNTMNSAAAGKTYIKMQSQLLDDDDCACFLVEAIAKKSQNIKWSTTVDGKSVSHKKIRRVSLDQFYALVTGQEDAFYKMCMRRCNVPFCIAMVVMPCTALATVPIGGFLFMKGSLSLSTLVMCLILSMGLVTPLITVMSYSDDIGKMGSILGEVTGVLSWEEQLRPINDNKQIKDYSICLENVRFSYREKEVLHGVNLKIESGTVNALVGPSGSGKSTIAKLIASLWDVDSGSIKIGGVDISELSLKNYNRNDVNL